MVKCPFCHRGDPKIVAVLAVPGDCRFQLFHCDQSGRGSAGEGEESRRGSLDSDCFDHYAWPVDAQVWQRTLDLLKVCPDPEEEDCGCCAHQQLARHDQAGRWLGLRGLP